MESMLENFLGHLGQLKCLAFWWWWRMTSFLNDFSQQKQKGLRQPMSLLFLPIENSDQLQSKPESAIHSECIIQRIFWLWSQLTRQSQVQDSYCFQLVYKQLETNQQQQSDLEMRNVCKFNPLTGETTLISQKQSEEIKDRRKKRIKRVGVCSACLSIVHVSTLPERRLAERYYERSISEVTTLQNHRTKIQDEKVSFFCNSCGQPLGTLSEDHTHIAMDTTKADLVVQKLAQQTNNSKQIYEVVEEDINVSAYNGLRIVSLRRLLVKLMYSKCQRYQTALFSMMNELQNYQTAFKNFIKVINAFKQEGESATKRLISEDLKQSSFNSLTFEDRSKVETKSVKEKTSRSHCKKEMDFFKQDIKVSCLSTTAFQQNTSMVLRSRVSRLLSPIRQTAQ